jgi:hypothetical protein
MRQINLTFLINYDNLYTVRFPCRICTCSDYDLMARGIIAVKALCYMLEGRGFETRWGELISIYLILLAALGSGVYSASYRNYYQKQKNNVSG